MIFVNIGAAKAFHGIVLSGVLDFQFCQGCIVFITEIFRKCVHLQRIEKSLGVFQDIVHRGKLGEKLRISGGITKGCSPFYHHLSEPQSKKSDSLFRFQVANGVEIIGLDDTGNRRIKIRPVHLPGQFLDDNGHFFFFCSMQRSFCIGSRCFHIC